MGRVKKMNDKGASWTTHLTETALKKINDAKKMSRPCRLMAASETEFEVREKNTHYTVDLMQWHCDCGVWDVTGLPCRHAALAIAHRREGIEVFTHHSYTKDAFMMAYGHPVHSVPDPAFWGDIQTNPSTLNPPPLKRQSGRPRVNRRREAGEGSSATPSNRTNSLKCGTCGMPGHNKRTCQGGPVKKRTKKGKRTANTVEMDIESEMPLADVVRTIKRKKTAAGSSSQPTASNVQRERRTKARNSLNANDARASSQPVTHEVSASQAAAPAMPLS